MIKGRDTLGKKNGDTTKKKIHLRVMPLGPQTQSVDPLRPKKMPGLCITESPGPMNG